VLDHPGLDRAAAFARLGELVEELGGMFYTAGDLGTTAADLEIMARHCQYVQTRLDELSRSVARGVVASMEACAQVAGKHGLPGLCVAVQGCGAVGSAVARELAHAGAELVLADIDENRARSLAAELDARVAGANDILTCDADIISPCAIGGVITTAVAQAMRGWALCGAANRIIAEPQASQRLHARGILHVPDVVASAGAVVDGVGETIMGLADRSALIDALGQTALELLVASKESGRPTDELAEEHAWARIRAAR
jgi:leucine dehydrogenase